MLRVRRWATLLAGAVCLFAFNAWADSPALNVAVVGQEPVPLRPYFSVLEDPGATLTLSDVQSEAAGRFQPSEVTTRPLNFGSTASAYWLRLRIDNRSTSAIDSMLEIYYPRLAEVDFYRVSSGLPLQSVKTGYARPFSERAYAHRFFVLPLPMAPGAQQTIYIRVKSPTSLEVPAQLWSRSAFHAYEIVDHMTQAAYFGMFVAMALFNILLWISLKERNYLFYVLFISSLASALAASTGIGIQYIWRDAPAWTAISFAVSGHLAMVWLISFTRRLLTTEALMPRWDLALRAGIAVNALLAFTNFVEYTSKLSASAIAVTAVLLLVCSSRGAIRGQRSAILFTAAFLLVLLGSVASMLRMLGVLPVNVLTINGIQIGSALEMILLSFTLADRIHLLRAEKEKAQQHLVDTLQNSEQVLEARVAQRTADMQILNERLEALSVTDSLTGIANRRRFDEVLQSEWIRAARGQCPLALAMVDVDLFKPYNDHYGHQAGDEILRHVARTFTEAVCRTGDLVARYGGEEFAFIAPLTDGENAFAMAQKVCEAIQALNLPHTKSPIGYLTVSIGVAMVIPHEDDSPQDLIARADWALYQAKTQGRNRVVLAASVV